VLKFDERLMFKIAGRIGVALAEGEELASNLLRVAQSSP
jgi:hypothetical protein